MSQCKSCKAPIKWITTWNGKSHPVDEKPVKMWQEHPGPGPDTGRWQLIDVHTSHFATCPNADQHRRKSAG